MNKKNSPVLQLVLDQSFQDWVLNPTDDLDRYWNQWMIDNPESKEDISQAKAIINSIDFKTSVPGLNEKLILQKIKARIRAEDLADELSLSREEVDHQVDDEVEETVIYSLPRKNTYLRWTYNVASAAAVILIAAIAYFHYNAGKTVRYATDFGQTREVTLPDGSKVVLNANSELSYQSGWHSGSDRHAELTGEAYFSVVHTENDQKFIVHSNDIKVEVLGTTFNVNNRRGRTQVVLESGKVQIKLPKTNAAEQKEPLLMHPGDLVEVSEKDNKITRKVTNTRYYSSWKNGELIFNSVPLKEVFELIQDRYGYDVTVKEEGIQNLLFEAEIQSTDLDLIIRVIARSFDLDIIKNEKELIVAYN